MDELPTVSDMLLDATRSSYLDSANVDFLPDLDADCAELAAAVASTRFKTETETACANALTFLGVVCTRNARTPPSALSSSTGFACGVPRPSASGRSLNRNRALVVAAVPACSGVAPAAGTTGARLVRKQDRLMLVVVVGVAENDRVL